MSVDVKKLMGAKILSEANDLKRTIAALAKEIEMDQSKLEEIVKGNCTLEDTRHVISRMGQTYPVDESDFYFPEDDCTDGARIMTAAQSAVSSRIFDRKDKTGNRTPFYDYRDTAMSKTGPFKPEWIKELRIVDNNDPYNPDIAYNNGHFLHQMTFFIGPVNFYWEVRGKKYCAEMNTGDSNYITPFWPHSFASRDKNQTALIIAVTYGGDVRRAQKEFYMLGLDNIHNYKLDMDNSGVAVSQLIKQHMANENMTLENLQDAVNKTGERVDVKKTLAENTPLTFPQAMALAQCLNVDVADLYVAPAVPGQEVVVKKSNPNDIYTFYPDEKNKLYKINPLARCQRMTLMKGFDVEPLCSDASIAMTNPMYTSLHTYVYNYGDDVQVSWVNNGRTFKETLGAGGSMYLKPFIRHAFTNSGKENGKLCVVRVAGGVNISTQKELSYFADINRVIETKCWFD